MFASILQLDLSTGIAPPIAPTINTNVSLSFRGITALDLIKGALRKINSYQSGETIAQADAQDSLDTLNDLLDSYSNDHCIIFGTNEYILQWQAGKNQYTVGNPTCVSIGEQPFIGTLTQGSQIITNVTSIPTDLKSGATLADLAGVIPPNTTVLAVGTNSVTMSLAATATPSLGAEKVLYTIPGDFAIPRPLRITNGFTRINQLDFTLEVCDSRDRFLEILYKAQPGPWPTVAWYNPLMPYGVLNAYQTPGQNAELHLFCDTLLQNLTLNQTFVLPQGYTRALKWCLAKELCAEYGFPVSESIKTNAAEALNYIKAMNARPAVESRYDRQLVRGNRGNAGWILTGGFY